jgi:hypothetical protein
MRMRMRIRNTGADNVLLVIAVSTYVGVYCTYRTGKREAVADIRLLRGKGAGLLVCTLLIQFNIGR